MKIPDEVKCKICAAVFCCGKCREKHEDKFHKEAKAIRQICYICNNRPFPLRTDTKITAGNVLVDHILREHLPLRCNRCTKVFHTVADFKSIVRCFNPNHSKDNPVESVCHLEHNPNIPTILEMVAESPTPLPDENKENIDENCSSDCSAEAAIMAAPPTVIKVAKGLQALSTSEIVQPLSKELRAIVDPPEALGEVNEAMLTPLSMINLRWKRKSRQSFDSMNNISAVNVSEGAVVLPTSPGKKLTRSTSTPMMHGCLPQNLKVGVSEESYSCGQMSSIHSNSESDIRNHNNTPNSPTSYEINKVRAIIRSKSKVAATPLRQVMSKSIQRAIAQHGYIRMIAPGTQRKMSFSSTGSLSGLSSTSGSPSRSMALDLRTTPVLKRTSSEGCTGPRNAKMIRLEAKSQSEDISGSTLDDASSLAYYDTHQNAESLNQSTEQEEQENHRDNQNQRQIQQPSKAAQPVPTCYNETPKVVAGGGILKKVISFSPEKTRLPPEDPDESSDVWATPCAIPARSYSCSALKDLRSNSQLLAAAGDSSDDVFTAAPVARSKSCKQLKQDVPAVSTGKLWTIVSSVIRLASRQDLAVGEDSGGGGRGTDNDGKFSAASLAKKAASFAGFLRTRLPSAAPLARRNSSSGSDEFSPSARAASSGGGGIKRRRAASIYARPYESVAGKTSSSPLAKRKRIQGRQPIERMRTNSSGRSGSGSDF